MTGGIRFCTSGDGTRLAFTVEGSGPPLVIVGGVDSVDNLDRAGFTARHWRDLQTAHFTTIRFDPRGVGMSQREPLQVDAERLQQDIDAVADAAGQASFAIFGFSNAVAVAVRYAASRPQRVERLACHGGHVRGRLQRELSAQERCEVQVALDMLAVSGGVTDEFGRLFRQAFSKQHFPSQSVEFYAELDRLVVERVPHAAQAAYPPMMFNEDLGAVAPLVRCPTLVIHARHDHHTPVDEAQRLAALIPGAQLVVTESENHFPLPEEPAWQQVTQAVLAFFCLDCVTPARLTQRQAEVLQLVSRGQTDKQIARELALSPRTIEMHVAAALKVLGCSNRAEAVARAAQAGLLAR